VSNTSTNGGLITPAITKKTTFTLSCTSIGGTTKTATWTLGKGL
jgi:hypothetical protein